MNEKLRELVCHIVREVVEEEGVVTAVKLVKLLYLIDLEFFRRTRKLLTGLTWRYYLYGPYPDDFAEELDRFEGFGLQRKIQKHKDKTVIFFRPEYPEVEWCNLDGFSPTEKSIVAEVLKIWGLEDLRTLLDFVYLQTEPMQKAEFGEKLDFSVARPPSQVVRHVREIGISKDKASAIRMKLALQTVPRLQVDFEGTYDAAYHKARVALHEDERQPALSGRVELKASIEKIYDGQRE